MRYKTARWCTAVKPPLRASILYGGRRRERTLISRASVYPASALGVVIYYPLDFCKWFLPCLTRARTRYRLVNRLRAVTTSFLAHKPPRRLLLARPVPHRRTNDGSHIPPLSMLATTSRASMEVRGAIFRHYKRVSTMIIFVYFDVSSRPWRR